jgi:type I restriction enzyme S subunit
VKDFSSGKLDFSRTRLISSEEHAMLYKRCDPRRGDILIGRIGTLGKAVLVDTDREFSLFVSVGLIRFSQVFIAPVFLRLLLNSPLLENEYNRIKVGGGTHTNKLNLGDLHTIIFPFPPLAEQHRIVAKVDELMALCGRLETARNERESRRERLAAATHHHINNGANSEALRKHSYFYVNHLPQLTAQPEQIPALRRTILSLAVRGQLVPQTPSDEPASELLKRVQAEIARLVSAGQAKEQKRFEAGRSATELYDIPQIWAWVSLGQVAVGFRYGTSMKCSYERTGEPVLRIPNIDNGRINVEDLKFGPLPKREADALRLQLGDILIVRSNGSLNLVGRPALIEANAVGYCYAGYLVRVRTSTIHLDTRYLLLALSSAHVRDQIEIPIRTTVGLKNVNATELSNLMIPFPPLPEQHRIVAVVDRLMALCDRLEAQLVAAQDESSRLLEAVLHQSLAEAS